ncbi:PHD finger protein 20 isoform X2 [Anabas testudineus]|uniref:C2H2-type domain-containing protein n=1 Tax=Anabas testudineus TaxID=64144 RepID=A0A3Q1K0Y0_ANATE|nr:PHD finger protein 20 isoform X2 [Anabas testudineus]
MSKTPPNRRGITFEVGAQLEARDSLKNWYAANIEKIDYEDEKVLIHYRQWSHRYDEWFDWTSPYLRPVQRVQLRRQGLQDDASVPGFHVNDKVLASWSDCRFYPAKVISVNKDASYTVKFYDGVIQTVKGIHVKPFIKERGGGGKSRSSERNMVRRAPNRRDRRLQENGGPKNKRARRSTSEQEDESNSEDDEREEGMVNEKNRKTSSELEVAPTIKQEERISEHADQNKSRDAEKVTGLTNGIKMDEDNKQHNNMCHINGEVKKEEIEMEQSETKPYAESPKPYTELTTHTSVRMEQVSVTMTTTESNGDVEQKPSVQSEISQPADVPPPQPVKPVRKQGFHNPNRFSREPLYRVIKNQPPPVLSINLDHNPFKCSAPGCTKSFRKAKLLHYHMKYYHGEEQPLEENRSPTRSIQTRASEKQATATGLDGPKRRRTISASMHSVGSAAAPRGEVKTAGRRTSAPPAVNTQGHQQRALLREKSKENQLDRNGCQQQDKDSDKSGFDPGSVKDKLKEKPRQKDFLRIKLKKKKKKKKKAKSDYTGSEENIDISVLGLQSKLNLPLKPPLSHNHKPEAYTSRPGYSYSEQIHVDDEDSISDWSTDSCGWSDDDFGVDLDVTTPPLSVDSGAVDTSDQEIVRCICEVEEENDFMIQCEDCLCWQHGTCMGLLEENVPVRYTCYICREPPGQRQSLRYWYDREWLINGHMYGLSFLEENYSHQNAKKITTTHQLLGDVHHVVEILSGLQLKMNVLQSNAHHDLQLWRQPWKHLERSRTSSDSSRGSDAAPSPVTPDEDMSRGEILMSNALEKLSRAATAATSSLSCSSSPFPSFQDSYITSEHCYQKPRAYYPAVEQRLVVETRQGSELEDSMRSTEELLEREQRYGSLLETDKPKLTGTTNKASLGGSLCQVEVKEDTGREPGQAADNSRQHQQWQINLLDHIDAVQDEVSHRMDFIERELDVLESWLDYTGELEPPEPLARLPQLKHRMKRLLTQLSKVQQIALYSST